MKYVGRRFFLEAEIGHDSLTTSFRALDLESGQPVTLRRFHSRFGADPRFAVRFREHLRALIAIDHDNLLTVVDYGLSGGDYYIASEWVDGIPLVTYLAEQGAMDSPVAVHVILKICAAVAELHAHGLLHRGLRADNVLLTSDGCIKVANAGYASLISESGLSKTHVMLDGIGYISPEQARGEPITVESDIYSIGVLLFELLTGRLPFESGDSWSIIRKHAQEPPPSVGRVNPLVPAEVAQVVEKCLQKDGDHRFDSAEEMIAALSPLPQSEPFLPAESIRHGEPGAGIRQLVPAVLERLRRSRGPIWLRSLIAKSRKRRLSLALPLTATFVASFAVAFFLLWAVTGIVIGSPPPSTGVGPVGSGPLNRAISRPLPTPTLAPRTEFEEEHSEADDNAGISEGEEAPTDVEPLPDTGPPIISGSPSQGGGPPDHARGPKKGRGPKPGKGPKK